MLSKKVPPKASVRSLEAMRRKREYIRLPPDNSVQRRINTLPFGEKLFEHQLAVSGQNVKALVALILFAPFAHQQALGLQAAQERIESAFVNLHAMLAQRLAKCVAVLLGAELRETRQDQRAAAQLHANVLEKVGFDGHTVHHPLYTIHCMTHSIGVKCFFQFFCRLPRRRDRPACCLAAQAGVAPNGFTLPAGHAACPCPRRRGQKMRTWLVAFHSEVDLRIHATNTDNRRSQAGRSQSKEKALEALGAVPVGAAMGDGARRR